ncbi:MAG: ATP-binding cassette domain-containing protein [Saccharolobus sp.]|jgi:energy-coupling factor transporter ATP-binding protein EcfA2|uniref:ATP-binding cassette domain-containing protein n=1 Tax=Saccharolobus sp. TaxID=2100761 RepID=UPI0028CF956F|nr:ATP-binding cassette domain-containing protein [Saccharolobus sp.]MDT7861486.1 ATP-binding cassette domain-containing protein [Saccharolobus sp.]
MLIISPKYLSGKIEIERDERVGLIGKNGSGKTTLIISTLCLSDKISDVFVDNVDFCSSRDYSKVSAVLQDVYSQILSLTCKEEINLMKRFHFVNEEIPKRLMGKYYDEEFSKLSDGYKRRYVIACILASNPSYILLDEPLANLDEEGINIVNSIIPKSSLIAEHRIEEIRKIIDRVYLIKNNQEIREIGKDKLFDESFLKNEGLRGFRLPKIESKIGNEILNVEVNNFKIKVREGEVLCLLGKNGSGKTTILKKLAKKVFTIFQEVDLQFFYFTVREMINDKKVITLFKLEDLLDRSPYTLSFGQKMRVLIASAFSSDSKVIGLDEPSVGMDGEALLSFYEMVKLLKEDKRGLIIATHDKDLINLCDSKIYMY